MSEAQAPATGGQGADTGAAATTTAANTQSTGVTTTTTAAPVVTTTAPTIEWLPGADETTVGLVQNKGWKTPADMLTSYNALEKFVGVPADKMLRLPTDASLKEELDAFYTKLGRPADPKEYSLAVPQGSDPAFANEAAGKFHELGLSTKQAQALTAWYNGKAESAGTQSIEQQTQSLAAQQTALKTEWGAGYEAQLAVARNAATQFGVTGAQIDGLEKTMGYDGVHKLFANIGSKLGEGGFHTGGDRANGFAVMTPGQAKAELMTLRGDKEFTAKYLAGNADAKARMTQLQSWANPE